MWKPSADIQTIKARARMLQSIRAFFAARDVLEVSTPIISRAANTDPHLDSIAVEKTSSAGHPHYLLTSPELPMKRMLAAGVGDCYQIAQVFRANEVGRNHNPEFTMLEWYRLGFDLFDLIAEVEQLILSLAESELEIVRISYADLFQQTLKLDVLAANADKLNQLLIEHDLWEAKQTSLEKNEALDLIFSQIIAPQLPSNQLTSVYHYPASQASLARINPDDPRTAARFETYWGELELANGFYELANAEEQRKRFEQDNVERENVGKPEMPLDQHFLTALKNGLPDCSGVALGLDRLLMKQLNKKHIRDVLSFDWERI